MRKYSVIDYPKKQKDFFSFLIKEYGCSLKEDLEGAFDYICEYRIKGIRVHLNYDYRDNTFNFYLIRGDNTKFPNDHDDENIRSLLELFKKYEPTLDVKKLLPDDKQYLESLERNALYLKKYGDKILRGIEWF